MTREAATGKDVDVRGFAYAMEPARLRQQWRVDTAMAELARAEKALGEAEAELETARHLRDAEAGEAAAGMRRRLDPAEHRRTLAYLSLLTQQVVGLERERDAKLQLCGECRRVCLSQQLRLEALTAHKDDALTEYAAELRQRGAIEQDRDWLARAPGRAARAGRL